MVRQRQSISHPSSNMITVTHRSDGVSLLTFTNPPVNALATALQFQLSQALKSLHSRSHTRAIVIHATGSPGFFSSGADVNEFAQLSSTYNPFTPENSWCYSGCEDGPKPVVAAIDGICFGGALELVLCCTARIATVSSSFSLPELKLGIIPGLGGTQRLPRLIGFEKAVNMMLNSTVLPAKTAKDIGLIDEIIQTDLIETAAKYAIRVVDGEVKRYKNIDRTDRIENAQSCRKIAVSLKQTTAMKLSKGGQLPQYDATIDVALYGVVNGGRKGLIEESNAFIKLVTAPHSKGLVHTFFSTRAVSKVSIPNDKQPNVRGVSPKKVGVIGGGLMGAGIATALISVDIPVIVKELNEKFALAAKKRVERNLGKKVVKMSHIKFTTNYNDLHDVDIVIEAAPENPKLKIEIFTALESVCSEKCIFASNTSTINLDMIAMGAPKAHKDGRVLGVHFFSPAHKMPLLEIVRTERTNPKVVKDVVALGLKIKKTPVLAGNCTGFAVNRMYLSQSMIASFLVLELGISPYRIDRAFEAFGLPMGPFRLLDLVGVDIGVAIGEVFAASYPDRTVGASSMLVTFLNAGRKGQKSGVGFYKYNSARVGEPDPRGIAPFIEEARSKMDQDYIKSVRAAAGELSDRDIVHMVLLACVNEGCRILDEKIVQRVSDLDICSIMGMAFPPHKGGLMYWAQDTYKGALGVKNQLETYLRRTKGFPCFRLSFGLTRSAKYNGKVGELFRPPLSPGNPDDIVVVSGFRTPVGRAGRGGLKDTLPDNLIIPVLERILKDTSIDPKDVDDIITGTVLQRGDTSVVQLRVAGLISGFPHSVPVRVVNRLCSSGLQAIADGAASIQAGHSEIVIAGGVESMSMATMNNTEIRPNPRVEQFKEVANCYLTMGQTSENVAEQYGISRERQDRLAVLSHARASLAKLAGRQSDEIVPIRTKINIINKETKKITGTKDVTVTADEGVRIGVTMDRLAKLPAVFKKGGTTTPGNSSQISDGAALVMLMKRSTAMSRKLEPKLALRSYAVAGVDPAVMGIGPVEAIPLAIKKAGITLDDVDLFEINEAFGSQADYCIEKLGLNRDIVNVNGGAIAIGHPLGMTGGRLTVSIMNELKRREGRFGVVSMCIGSGMGAAAVWEMTKPSGWSRL